MEGTELWLQETWLSPLSQTYLLKGVSATLLVAPYEEDFSVELSTDMILSVPSVLCKLWDKTVHKQEVLQPV